MSQRRRSEGMFERMIDTFGESTSSSNAGLSWQRSDWTQMSIGRRCRSSARTWPSFVFLATSVLKRTAFPPLFSMAAAVLPGAFPRRSCVHGERRPLLTENRWRMAWPRPCWPPLQAPSVLRAPADGNRRHFIRGVYGSSVGTESTSVKERTMAVNTRLREVSSLDRNVRIPIPIELSPVD